MVGIGHYDVTVAYEGLGDRKAFLADLGRENLLVRKLGKDHYYGSFPQEQFDFAGELRRLLVGKAIVTSDSLRDVPLEHLHVLLTDEQKALDQSELNAVSKAFYDTSDEFERIYVRFVREVLAPLLGEDLYFQATPTIRFQFPHQRGFDWKPRLHTDIMLGHPPQEINVWLPLKSYEGTNSMLLATAAHSRSVLSALDYDLRQFAWRVQADDEFWASVTASMHPVELRYGQFLLFDPICIHATQNNVSETTRISLDVRVLGRRDFQSMGLEYRGTGRRKMLFAPGHYYSEKSTRELADIVPPDHA